MPRWMPFVRLSITDIVRRAQGDAVGAFGLDPTESSYRIVASGTHWCLRDYGGEHASPSLLVIAAPIKRPYIWDLIPSVSAIRHCLQQGLHVYLLEWMPCSHRIANNGLDDYTLAISDCVATISRKTSGTKSLLIGHSLGGTLAAIFSAWAPASIQGLVLLGAPLCFQAEKSQFRDALVSLVPSDLPEADTFPGSFLSHICALASPGTFIWSRLMEAALSISDHHALELHARSSAGLSTRFLFRVSWSMRSSNGSIAKTASAMERWRSKEAASALPVLPSPRLRL